MNEHGRLELITGNMFSGKSSELIRRINRESSIRKRILVINYIDDNRYDNKSIVTHDNVKIQSVKMKLLKTIVDEDFISGHDSFFIDEGQFFEDLHDICIYLVDVCKKHVVVSGLDGDIYRNKFGSIVDIIPICDTVDKLCAYCSKCNDGTLAPFTKKIKDNLNENIIDIGGSDKYIPVCRKHYFSDS